MKKKDRRKTKNEKKNDSAYQNTGNVSRVGFMSVRALRVSRGGGGGGGGGLIDRNE